MSIFTYLREKKQELASQETYDVAHKEALDIFLRQQISIKGIADTEGFKEILAYLDREIEALVDRIATTDKQQTEKETCISLKMHRNLKKFLENLANS